MSDDNSSLYKEWYYKEIERKEQINSRIQMPLSIVVILIGGIFYCVQNVHKIPEGARISFFIIIGLSLVTLVIAIGLIMKCIFGQKFGYLPVPSEIEKYRMSLVAFHKKKSNLTEEEIKKIVNQKVNTYLQNQYVNLTDKNILSNDKKTKFLLWNSYLIGFSIVLLSISFSFFIPDLLSGKEPTQKIEVIGVDAGNNNFEQPGANQIMLFDSSFILIDSLDVNRLFDVLLQDKEMFKVSEEEKDHQLEEPKAPEPRWIQEGFSHKSSKEDGERNDKVKK